MSGSVARLARQLHIAMMLWLAAALGSRTPTARAEAPLLRWQAPATCPTERDLLEQIAMRLRGRSLERQAILAEGSILLSDGRYNLTLRLVTRGRPATRSLSARHCKSLVDTASWLIAVALAPELAAAPAEDHPRAAEKPARLPAGSARLASRPPYDRTRSTRTSDPTSLASLVDDLLASQADSSQLAQAGSSRASQADGSDASQPESSLGSHADSPGRSTVSVAGAPVRHQPLRTTKLKFVSVRKHKRWIDDGADEPSYRGDRRRALFANLFAGVFSAGLPAPVSSLGGRLGIDFEHVSVQLRGAHMMARTREAGAVRVRFPMQELGAAGCVAWGERVRGGPCATLSLMRTAGFIEGASEPRRSVVFWGTAGVSAYLAWLVQRPFELSAETGVSLPISARPRFVLDEFGQLERASSLSLYARLGVGVRFP